MSIKDEILALRNEEGIYIAEDILEWARTHPESRLHASITWDADEAARLWQLEQVRGLIRVHVMTEQGDRKLISLSIDRVKPRGGYRDVDDVIPTPSLYAVMLEDALNELERIRIKYNRVTELKRVWDAAEDVKMENKNKNKNKNKPKRGQLRLHRTDEDDMTV